MMNERWAIPPGLSRYAVSDLGRVVSLVGVFPKLRSIPANERGYLRTAFYDDDRNLRQRAVHDLVLEAFVGPAEQGKECRHLNGNPGDNRLCNLAWGTASENALDRVRHGTHKESRKTHCKWGHEFSPENTYNFVGKNGRQHRQCIECRARRYNERNKK